MKQFFHDTMDLLNASATKLALSWFGALYSYMTLERAAVVLTIIYTSFNLYVLLRDKVFRRENQR